MNFTDNFAPPSTSWDNHTGNWTATGGKYYAQQANNNPNAASWLPFDLYDFSMTVHVDNLTDGGIFMAGPNSDDTSQSILLVLGGGGYGQGIRGGVAGTSAYWHVDGSSPQNQVNNVFTPGNSYDITVTRVGDTYSLFVDGSSTATTTLTTSLNPHGRLGLYDDQPNTTTGNGTGTPMLFSNFALTGTVPEPGSLSVIGLGLAGFLLKRRKK